MQIITTHSIWQQPSLVPTPQQSQLLSLLYKQIVWDDSDLNKSLKKKKKNGEKKCVRHPFLKPWRALRQNIIFFSLTFVA